MTAEWRSIKDNCEALFDPSELSLTFFFGIEQTYFLDPARQLMDIEFLNPNLADIVEKAHPGILYDPEIGAQRRPLSELGIVRGQTSMAVEKLAPLETSTSTMALRHARDADKNFAINPVLSDTEILDSIPASTLISTVYLDSLIACHPELQSSFHPYNYLRQPGQVNADILQIALEDAIMFVAEWTHSAYRLMRNAVHIFTAKVADPYIPYVLHTVDKSQPLSSGVVPNQSRLSSIRNETAPRTANTLEDFQYVDQLGPVSEFLAIAQEAESAFNRGLYRSAAIMSASGAEMLLNTTLQMLHWEDGLTPEESVDAWSAKEGIQARVRKHFPPLLKGNWDLIGGSPIGDWAQHTAELRNKIAHAGHRPTETECRNSLAATYVLHSDLVDRITEDANLNRYTRTAFLLAGNHGLESRGKRARKVRELQDDPSEPTWAQSSAGWIRQHAHCLLAKGHGWPTAGEGATETVLVVRTLDLHISAFERSREHGWAREIYDIPALLEQQPASSLREQIMSHKGSGLKYITYEIMAADKLSDSAYGPRVAAYQLVPDWRISPKWSLEPQLTFGSAETLVK